MENSHVAYAEAAKTDKQINRTLTKHPITKENYQEWRLFIRTVRTTLTILEEEIVDVAFSMRRK